MGNIIVKNAVKRKPDHLYYIDGQGNLCETEGYRNNTTFWEKIQIKWIDIFYR